MTEISNNNVFTSSEGTGAKNAIGLNGVGGSKFAAGIVYLYYFAASTNAVGAPPADVVPEDASATYTIVDLGGAKGRVLKKTSGGNKMCFFNGYNTFPVPVKTRFVFYLGQVTSYKFGFSCNLVNGANSGGYTVGFSGTSAVGTTKDYKMNTNAGLALDWGGMSPTATPTLPLNTVIFLETRIRVADNKTMMKYSFDEGLSWSVEFAGTAAAQNRVGYFDAYDGGTATVEIIRVEVTAL